MCKIEGCERHELWGGYCRPHLADHLSGKKPKVKRKSRKKKIDNEELVTTDATEVAEERTADE